MCKRGLVLLVALSTVNLWASDGYSDALRRNIRLTTSYNPVSRLEMPETCSGGECDCLKQCAACDVFFGAKTRHDCRQVAFVVKGRVVCLKCEN